MKKRFLVSLFLVLIMVVTIGAGIAEEVDSEKLHFDRWYLSLPEMNIRKDPETPGKIDTITAGTELNVLYTDDIWAVFTYEKDGEERTGCTWVGAVAQAVKIHLLKDEFIFHIPVYDRTDFGLIAAWVEPEDPDLLVLWPYTAEDGTEWLFVKTLSGRSGYMRADAEYEVVE